MADDNIAVTDLDPDVATIYAAIREAREQALRLRQRLRDAAAVTHRARASTRRRQRCTRHR